MVLKDEFSGKKYYGSVMTFKDIRFSVSVEWEKKISLSHNLLEIEWSFEDLMLFYIWLQKFLYEKQKFVNKNSKFEYTDEYLKMLLEKTK